MYNTIATVLSELIVVIVQFQYIKKDISFKNLLQNYLKEGQNYPSARQKALENYFHDEKLSKVIKEPNNILGIEYIKAMVLRNSLMKGFTITRAGASYHDTELSDQYSSASAIRNIFYNTMPDLDLLQSAVSDYSIQILKSQYGVRYPVVSDDFSLLLRYKLMSESKESLTTYLDITPDFANRIINLRNEFISISQFTELLKTKEITYSRISRCLIHILLNIRDCTQITDTYARVLGFRKESSDLFTIMKNNTQIPIITKLTSLDSLNQNQLSMLKRDIFASDLYESIISDKFKKPFINELTKQIIKY